MYGRFAWLLVCGATGMAASACDNPSGHAASRAARTDQPVILTPEDGPFTAPELLEVAYQYHPRSAAFDL